MKNLITISLLGLVLMGSFGCSKNSVPFSPSATISTTTTIAPTFVTQWSGSQTTSFSNPAGIAVDNNNDVYVVDSDLSMVLKFDINGQPQTQWGQAGKGNGQYNEPFGITIGSDGEVYVADSGNNRVQVTDSNGNYIKQLGSTTPQYTFSYPEGVAFTPEGNLCVSDIANVVWQLGAASVSEYGVSGTSTDQFNYPIGMAIDSHDNLYVADHQSNKIVKFNYTQNTIMTWGQTGSGQGQFKNPSDVKLDKNGNVYVVDYDNNRIQVFDENGNYLTQFGNSGSAQQLLSNPLSVAIGNNGSIYVTDSGNSRVVKYTL